MPGGFYRIAEVENGLGDAAEAGHVALETAAASAGRVFDDGAFVLPGAEARSSPVPGRPPLRDAPERRCRLFSLWPRAVGGAVRYETK